MARSILQQCAGFKASWQDYGTYMSNTVESTLFVQMEWIRNLIRTSDSTAFVSMFSNLLHSYEWSTFLT